MKLRTTIIFLILLATTICAIRANNLATPPIAPVNGPGSLDYQHASITQQSFGSGATAYSLYLPAEPVPASAPVIVFMHGFSAVNPVVYGGWIDHLVRRGNIVIYPRYQADLKTPTKDYTPNAIAAIKDALARLQSGAVKPELDKFAIVGHSAGGIITANIAALAHTQNLPTVRAVMSVEPGRSRTNRFPLGIPLANLSEIPADALLLTIVGDQDNIAGDMDAKKIFNQVSQLPRANKNYIIFQSDDHGSPALKANHFAPNAIDEKYQAGSTEAQSLRARLRTRRASPRGKGISIDALDYYGYWKFFDGLCDAAFYHKNRVYALGNSEQHRYMGQWSDGKPVKELIIIDQP